MYTEEDQHFVINEQMEKWLKRFFLDPSTSYFDQTQFQIDIYETEEDWIVVSILEGYESSDITVFVDGNKLVISAASPSILSNKKRIRVIEFPFQIRNQMVKAFFCNGVLEVFISKFETGLMKNRFITLP